jgi:uncharacterized protein YndB with AHSA1/START domain
MERIEVTVVVDRPVEEVWRLLTDMEAYTEAFGQPLGERYRVTSPGPLGLGSIVEANVYRVTSPEPSGLGAIADANLWEVGQTTEFEPNRVITITMPAPGRVVRHPAMHSGTISHRLEAIPEGTRFITSVDLEPKAEVIRNLPALRTRWQERVRSAVAGLKQAAERGLSPTAPSAGGGDQ